MRLEGCPCTAMYMLRSRIARQCLIAGVAIGVFCSAIVVGTVVYRRAHKAASVSSQTKLGRSRAPNRLKDGTELITIWALDSACGFSRYPGLPPAIAAIDKKLREYARTNNRRIIRIGMSMDSDPDVAIQFLRRFGPFDEVIAGGNWLNTGVVTYLMRDNPGPFSIPQLIVLERRVEGGGRRVGADSLIMRKVGYRELLDFAEVDPVRQP